MNLSDLTLDREGLAAAIAYTGDDPPLGITLSLGEQSREVYEEWFDAGAMSPL